MDAFRRQGRARELLCALLVGTCAAAEAGTRKTADPWEAAVAAREAFEAGPPGSHTRTGYSLVMEQFRAIYHGDPSYAHAGRAAEQVAELLAEEGRELKDRKSLHDAGAQFEWVAKAYPGGSMAPHDLAEAAALFRGNGADDEAAERRVVGELRASYPTSAEARAQSESRQPVTPNAEAAPLRKTGEHYRKPSALPPAAVTPIPLTESTHTVAPAAARPDAITARATVTESLSTAPAEAEDRDSARATPVTEPLVESGKLAMVTGIRHWSTSSYTRVAIDLGDEVQYQAARVENPDRIFFDLHHARLASQLAGKSFNVTDDGFLTRIRAAQFSGDVTRVVLDVHEIADYSAFLLPNPYRLIIDIHGKSPAEKGTAPQEQTASGGSDIAGSSPQRREATHRDNSVAANQETGASSSPAPAASGGEEVSSLPPMPVTDGSASFGLPPKNTANTQSAGTAASMRGQGLAPSSRPRVVISSRPTAAKPVPNSVATRSTETGTEVAAVSDQPGKVVATTRPTSQPIVARSHDESASLAGVDARNHGKPAAAHVSGTPVEAAPPTADGETSLMRALGLKIGRIVIDAGHGGHDSGTLGVGGIEEKDVVLDVALRLGKLLHERLGAEIVYTRADDTFIPLETRTAIANKAQADLFISVHANSSPDESARGVEVYYLNFTSDPDAMTVASRENAVSTQSVHELSNLVKKIALKDKIDESRELAADVDASLFAGLEHGNDGLKNRGVKKAPFVVLIGANMPSILAEISFVTNPDDADELARPAYRERVAESLYKGVARYAAGINAGRVSTAPTQRAAR